jgi:NitT/TauT family transport system permease protein
MAQEQAQPIALPALQQGSPSKRALFLTKLRPLLPFVVVIVLWQVAALQVTGGLKQLLPTPLAVLIRAWELTFDPLFTSWMAGEVQGLSDFLTRLGKGALWWHFLATAWRLPISFVIAAVCGVILGIVMGRSSFWESFFLPLIAFVTPIPALAWTPIAVIWFGLGDRTVIIVSAVAATLPITQAVWMGVKTVNPVWVRAAQSMNAGRMMIFRTVVLPGSFSMVLGGLRLGLGRAWIAVVGAEALAGLRWGLSAGIFDSVESLDVAFMLVSIATLGLFGYLLGEKVLFQPMERRTVIKWGMMQAIGAQDKKA